MYATRSPKIRKVDIIGDVHGCYAELIKLIEKLGYVKDARNKLYRHPDRRVLAFVGDLTDRGPQNRSSVLFALRHYEAGLAFYVQGNHDNHLGRWLQGGDVQTGYECEETIREFQDMSEGAKKKLSERLLNLPLFATFDDEKLMLCHASPPVEGESRTRTLGRCLYGRPTKRTLTHINQRLEWVKDYVGNADESTPFVVYGHVCLKKPWMTSHTCGIDTACFGGNALTAFRWPEKEIVQVESQNTWDQTLYFATPETKSLGRKLTTLNLKTNLEYFRANVDSVLQSIDEDTKINKREGSQGLIIANASKALFEPENLPQLFAKGIVYSRNPYKLVSLPLAKIFNHTRKELSDLTTQRMRAREDVKVTFPDKLDGTLIQLFEYKGQSYLTTRSVLEGTDLEGDNFDYIQAARDILEEKYPKVLDIENLKGKTFLFELIHPETKVVTDYEGLTDMVLLSIFDVPEMLYLDRESRYNIQNSLELTGEVYYNPEGEGLDMKMESLLNLLNEDERKPEGFVLCFEGEGQILHRVKVKTEEYMRYHKLKYRCSFARVVELVWDRPDLHTWEGFQTYLRTQGLSDEESETFYESYFTQFSTWLAQVRSHQNRIEEVLKEFNATHDKTSDTYYKRLAFYSTKHAPELMGLIMRTSRRGALPLKDVMRTFAPYSGFKGVVDRNS